MRYRNKLIFLLLVLLLLAVLQLAIPGNPNIIANYGTYIFRPFQSFRNSVFGFIPFSIGDLFYAFLGILIIVVVAKWLYYLIRVRSRVHHLNFSLLHTVSTIGVLYIVFFLGWGGNYYRPSLSKYWHLDKTKLRNDSNLIAFDRYLIGKLNEFAPYYQPLPFKEVNRLSQLYYKVYTDSKTRMHGLKAKPSLFGVLMQYLGIQGYYNPFTGEAQVNTALPAYMLPFVTCHEMAHQSGIAAEDDANLLAYVVGTVAHDTPFNYSAYLNIWLYTQSRLRVKDSALAATFKKQLNPLTLRQLDTLRSLRFRYKSGVGEYSSELYDSYLRWHHQKEGIDSYSKVVSSAWIWQQERAISKDTVIRVP